MTLHTYEFRRSRVFAGAATILGFAMLAGTTALEGLTRGTMATFAGLVLGVAWFGRTVVTDRAEYVQVRSAWVFTSRRRWVDLTSLLVERTSVGHAGGVGLRLLPNGDIAHYFGGRWLATLQCRDGRRNVAFGLADPDDLIESILARVPACRVART